jgi:hypothetical protein
LATSSTASTSDALPASPTSEHALLLALCSAYQQDELVRAVLRIAFANAAHMSYLDAVVRHTHVWCCVLIACVCAQISAEIDACAVETTLFRTDSLATKSVTAFFKLVCVCARVCARVCDYVCVRAQVASDYLKATLGGLVKSVVAAPDGCVCLYDRVTVCPCARAQIRSRSQQARL